MKNLEQLRARHALSFWAHPRSEEFHGEPGHELVRACASWVLHHGLLGALAIAKSRSTAERRSVHEELFLDTGRFMANRDRGLLPFPVNNLDDLVRGLSSHSSELLQQATGEALAYLEYLQRFHPR